MADHVMTLSTGRRLGYAEYGNPSGVPMFYFHGWPSSRLQGELMHEVGRNRRLRIIAPDRPGIGLSEFQPGRKLLDWPPVLAELAEHLGWDRFHVLAVSGGGPYALATVHAMPERVLSAGVVCGAPPLRKVGTDGLMWTYRLALWAQRRVPVLLAPGLAAAAQMLRLPQDSLPMRTYVRALGERDRLAMADPELYCMLMESGRACLLSSARGVTTDGNIYTSDWGIDFNEVQFPIRYWHGALDRNIPPALVERFVGQLPNARLSMLDEEGHYSLPLLKNDEIVAELLSQG